MEPPRKLRVCLRKDSGFVIGSASGKETGWKSDFLEDEGNSVRPLGSGQDDRNVREKKESPKVPPHDDDRCRSTRGRPAG